MGVRLKGLLGLITIGATAIALTQTAMAQDATSESPGGVSLRDAFARAYYSHDGTFYQNRTLARQADWILGAGTGFSNGFTDNEIGGDGESVDRLYRDALQQQVNSTPPIRTADLVSPYDTSYSLLPTTAPESTSLSPVPIPAPAPSNSYSPPPAPAPAPVPVAPARPIPALW